MDEGPSPAAGLTWPASVEAAAAAAAGPGSTAAPLARSFSSSSTTAPWYDMWGQNLAGVGGGLPGLGTKLEAGCWLAEIRPLNARSIQTTAVDLRPPGLPGSNRG